MERPYRQRELHGLEPDRAGARYRESRDGGGQRQSDPAIDGAGQRRSRGSRRYDQQHDRHARHIRRAGDERCARGRRGGPARRTSQCARRVRNVEGSHRQRQLARGEPHQSGARDRGSRNCGDQGRPHALHPGRDARRGGRAERQHQYDDFELARDDVAQSRRGLVEDKSRALYWHAARPARAQHGRSDPPQRAKSAHQSVSGHDLSPPQRRWTKGAATSLQLRSSRCDHRKACSRRGTCRPMRAREEAHPAE